MQKTSKEIVQQMKQTIILGISAYYHDSAAALIVDGEIIAAAQEERFNRIKNTSDFPKQAILYCLNEYGIDIASVNTIVFYDKPFLKFERLLETYHKTAPKGFISFSKFMPEWGQKKIFLRKEIRNQIKNLYPEAKENYKILFSAHHLSHAASAFYPSPFQKAAILTIDGVGEWATATIGIGDGNDLKILKELHFPDSVGLLYSAFTYFLGFKVNNGEYKLMGLSPYGVPNAIETEEYIDEIKNNLVQIFEDGSIQINQKYFKYRTNLRMINEKKWEKLFEINKRKKEEPFLQSHANLAYAIQTVIEDVIFKMAKTAKEITGANNLCLAGGVALNSVANGKLLKSELFDDIWIQPAAGDAGGALGAALAIHYLYKKENTSQRKPIDQMKGAFLGPSFTPQEIKQFIREKGLQPKIMNNEMELCDYIATQLDAEKIIGWVKGRMEFGPRALGARSILASPKPKNMQKKLNHDIKFREDFRPFAPVMLQNEAEHYFSFTGKSAYMQYVQPLLEKHRQLLPKNFEEMSLPDKLATPRSKFQAITHVDFSARIQIVQEKTHPLWQLLTSFKSINGDAMLVNTSFNTKGQPIVCSLDDIYDTYINTDISILVVENYIFIKEK